MSFEDRLSDRFFATSETLPGRPLDWAETYARARRGRTIYRAVVVCGTALVLAAGGFVARAMLERPGGGPAPLPPASSETPGPRSRPSPSDEPEAGNDVSYERPYRAVESFIQGAAEGDAEAMWAEMTDASQAVYDHDIERFRESAISAIQEGWGSWAAAVDLGMQWQVIASSGDGATGVVTLMGQRAPEGHEEPYASAAIPVRVDSDGDAKIELFVGRGIFEYRAPRDLTVDQPPAMDTLTTRPSFEVFAPGSPTEVYMVVAPVPLEPAFSAYGKATVHDRDEDRVRAVWRPEERLFSGEWFLTVVAMYEDGSMQADSVRFTIE